MAYPTLPITYGGTHNTETGRQLERASNGAVRGRVMYSADRGSFKFTHEMCSASQLTTFKSFFSTNKNTTFDFVWPGDGQTYTCLFADKDPQYKPTPGGWYDIDVELWIA